MHECEGLCNLLEYDANHVFILQPQLLEVFINGTSFAKLLDNEIAFISSVVLVNFDDVRVFQVDQALKLSRDQL